MLNLSRIQLELERAKEKLRNVEETIQKVEGKTFSNGPVRYSSLKVELHSDKTRNPVAVEDVKNQRRRVIASSIDSRVQRLPSDDVTFSLKRGLREKRDSGVGLKRQGGDTRPQGVFARLSGLAYQQADDEDEEEFAKKPTLPSRVFTTASEAPSRQEVIAAQAVDEQSKQRNKRMFGALVGTLQKFRKEETRVREREEKRLKVEKKLEEDAKREKEKLMQEKRELFLEKKRREVEIKRIEWSLNRVKEYEAWEANVIPLKNFIQTQAKPHIFYLPSVHNAKTEERLAHSQKIVERMIEKRKTNLKEEIENSEKKARKTAAEEAEEEEAENIPEDNEETHNPEQQMDVDFEADNKENGYLEEEAKGQDESSKDLDETKDTGKVEENWSKVKEPEEKEPGECVENENEINSSNVDEIKEESPITENKDSNNDFNSIKEERAGDDEISADGQLGKNVGECGKGGDGGEEERMCENEKSQKDEFENETNCRGTEERIGETTTETNLTNEVTAEESENVEKTKEEANEERGQEKAGEEAEKILEKNTELQSTDKKESISEISERKNKDSAEKTVEESDKKGKVSDTSRRTDKSRNRKTSIRSRSPRRKSRSPRRSSRSRRRSGSRRRRRPIRKRSRSDSLPKKSRRSRSPVVKRGQRTASSSKRRSPHKSRRRSSSRSSSSVSPRKKRSRSSSSSSSKSD